MTPTETLETILAAAYARGQCEDHDGALRGFERALRVDPRSRRAALGRASALMALQRFEQALAATDYLSTDVSDAVGLGLRARILALLERFEEAVELADALLRQGLGDRHAYLAMVMSLWRLKRYRQAIAIAEDAVRRFPQDYLSHLALAECYLASGDYPRGWPEYEYRPLGLPAIGDSLPRWRGEPAADRSMFVYSEAGIGDTIQFIRFLPELIGRFRRPTVLVQSGVLELCQSTGLNVDWVGQPDHAGAFDYQASLLSLPGLFATAVHTIPPPVSFQASHERIAKWHSHIGEKGLKVGIVWQGNPAYPSSRRRAIPLVSFEPLVEVPRIRLISLQAIHGLDQLDHLPSNMSVETLGPEITDNPNGLAEIAAAMFALDVVVTTDTSIAHLAGALGRPVWLALADVPEWRWMLERTDSPWYPSARLFRQKRRGDWISVFTEIAEALRAFPLPLTPPRR